MNQQRGNNLHNKNQYRNARGSNNRPELEPVKPISLYDGENIRSSLVDKDAEDQLKKFGGMKITSTQLRRYFHELKGYYNQFKINENDFMRLLPMIKMVKPNLYYAYNRKKIDKGFADFFIGRIDQIQDPKSFHAIMMHIEAVIGFMYGKGKVSNK